MPKLEQLNFENSYARLPDGFYSRLDPAPLPDPYLVCCNAHAASLIDMDSAEMERADFVEYFSGNRILPGAEPLAMLYAGHQFGQYVSQLGDGRAILLGEVRNRAGQLWDVQLKGAGQTPYSRRGDGRAVLRSCIREYLCSEAMHGLGIPTTRALCVVGSDENVYREATETAAVLTRLALSHVRFGSFEVFFYRGQHQQIAQLADYVIARHFPHLVAAADKYPMWLDEVSLRTARLMAQWQAVGFAHGVMNTDNMSILGLTLDYGPFGFMESYDPGYICNHSDPGGRYAYDQQPQVGLWNIACLAQALTPLIPSAAIDNVLERYAPAYYQHYAALMGAKLGLTHASMEEALADFPLVDALLKMMHASQLDYTSLFRSLGNFNCAEHAHNDWLRDQFIDRAAFDAWAANYRARLQHQPGTDTERKVRMDAVNPKYILRNYLAQTAIAQAEKNRDFSEIDRLLNLLSKPCDEQPELERYAAASPQWARQIEVSCSS